MKKEYKDFQEFEKDLWNQYTMKDLGFLRGYWTDKDFIHEKIRCPFHSGGHEKTPSLQIGNSWFRCYGCDKKGSWFKYVMLKEKCMFPEAISITCELVGCSIQQGNYKPDVNSKKFKMLKEMWEQYKQDFIDNVQKNPALKKQGERLWPLEVGYDKSINRLVVCYEDTTTNRVYGFSKRCLDDSKPKWIHSDDRNSLIGLCHNIYNLGALDLGSEINIVEGPGDVGGMKRANFQNSIAISGCENFNQSTINLLQSRGINSVNFVMDADDAGRKANINNSKVLIYQDYMMAKNSFVSILPTEGSDPGECDSNDIKQAIKNKINLINYFIENNTEIELRNIYNSKQFFYNPIRQDIEKYLMNKYNWTSMQVKEQLKNKDEERLDQNEYISRLKSTCGLSGFEDFPPLEGIEPDEAKIILFRRFGIRI